MSGLWRIRSVLGDRRGPKWTVGDIRDSIRITISPTGLRSLVYLPVVSWVTSCLSNESWCQMVTVYNIMGPSYKRSFKSTLHPNQFRLTLVRPSGCNDSSLLSERVPTKTLNTCPRIGGIWTSFSSIGSVKNLHFSTVLNKYLTYTPNTFSVFCSFTNLKPRGNRCRKFYKMKLREFVWWRRRHKTLYT